jgi:hypothetical protein
MPGGKGKIRPEDGKQFSTDYQPEEKWTEEKALKVASDLKEWHKTDQDHIFWEEFLMIDNDYPEKLISYLCRKFSSFATLIESAKKIQEIKLKKYGTADTLNAAMTKFVLINEHNWRDKQELTGADGKDLNSKITIELIDSSDKVDKDEDSGSE